MSWKRPPPRPAKQIEGEITPRPIAPSIGISEAIAHAPDVFRPMQTARVPSTPHAIEARGRRIRESARGEQCQVRYVGICSHDPAKTIWSHARWGAQLGEGGRGMSTKASDILGAYACTACDAAYDQMTGAGDMTRAELDLDWMMGLLRSIVMLEKKGIV